MKDNEQRRDYNLRIQSVSLAILTIIAVAVSLHLMRAVVVPFVLASFFTMLLIPLIDFQVLKLKLFRPLALLLTLLFGFLILFVVGGLISVSVNQLASNASEYESQLQDLITQASESEWLQERNIHITEDADIYSLMPDGAMEGFVVRLTSGIFALLSQGMLVMLFVTFLLLGRQSHKMDSQGVLLEIETRVKRYILTKTTLSALTGVLVFTALSLIGVDYAMAFGAIAFLLNFIPTFGSIIATFLPLPVILIQPGLSSVSMVLAILIPGVIQFSIGSVLEPKIMGDVFDIHPVVVLMSLIFWGVLWGFNGMFLAIPMTAIMQIIFTRIEVTQPIALIMSGRFNELNIK
jgi:AI-2 transport protein TqsA